MSTPIDHGLGAAYDPWMRSFPSVPWAILAIVAISAPSCHQAVTPSDNTAAGTSSTGAAEAARAVTAQASQTGGGVAATTSPRPAVAGAPLRMHAVVNHGYGCGGHCAFNFSGRSDVEVVFGPGGEANARDVGWFERSESYPDAHVDSKRTWQFEWRGEWAGDDHRRSVKLQLGAASCDTTETGSRTSGPTPCTKGPALIELECAWGPPPPPEPWARAGGTAELGQLTVAWVCNAPSALPSELGTDLPWVFAPGAVVERRAVGEPEPTTSYGTMAPVPVGTPNEPPKR